MDYILTDGKNYVMENPYRQGDYILVTNPNQATKMTWNRAHKLTQRKGKKYSQIRECKLVGCDDGEIVEDFNPNYKGNAGAYIGDKDLHIDESMIDDVIDEANSLIGIAGWDSEQLNCRESDLNNYLSFFDLAESDIKHALQKYYDDHNGAKPQAHKVTKIGYLMYDIRHKRQMIKQAIRYIEVLKDAIKYHYSLSKIKNELKKVENEEYKGRTKFWKIAIDILYN